MSTAISFFLSKKYVEFQNIIQEGIDICSRSTFEGSFEGLVSLLKLSASVEAIHGNTIKTIATVKQLDEITDTYNPENVILNSLCYRTISSDIKNVSSILQLSLRYYPNISRLWIYFGYSLLSLPYDTNNDSTVQSNITRATNAALSAAETSKTTNEEIAAKLLFGVCNLRKGFCREASSSAQIVLRNDPNNTSALLLLALSEVSKNIECNSKKTKNIKRIEFSCNLLQRVIQQMKSLDSFTLKDQKCLSTILCVSQLLNSENIDIIMNTVKDCDEAVKLLFRARAIVTHSSNDYKDAIDAYLLATKALAEESEDNEELGTVYCNKKLHRRGQLFLAFHELASIYMKHDTLQNINSNENSIRCLQRAARIAPTKLGKAVSYTQLSLLHFDALKRFNMTKSSKQGIQAINKAMKQFFILGCTSFNKKCMEENGLKSEFLMDHQDIISSQSSIESASLSSTLVAKSFFSEGSWDDFTTIISASRKFLHFSCLAKCKLQKKKSFPDTSETVMMNIIEKLLCFCGSAKSRQNSSEPRW